MPIQVTVWGENVHEQTSAVVQEVYPKGMHTCIADTLQEDPEITTRTATLQEFEHGLTEEVLASTDVLTWWGHAAHGQVEDAIVDRVQARVLEGMGLLVLHSGHYSKIFRRLLGTTCSLTWREAGELERVWVCNPGHPIAQGLGRYFEVPQSEMYGEPFQVPPPEEMVFSSWFQGGETFRSGLTYKRGNGKIFYFSPGHETYPIYHQPEIQLVLRNAVKWACPEGGKWEDGYTRKATPPVEAITERGPKLHAPGTEGLR
jgi:trehalose utilization protein